MEPEFNLVRIGNMQPEELNLQSAAQYNFAMHMKRVNKVAVNRFKLKLYKFDGPRNITPPIQSISSMSNQEFSTIIKSLGNSSFYSQSQKQTAESSQVSRSGNYNNHIYQFSSQSKIQINDHQKQRIFQCQQVQAMEIQNEFLSKDIQSKQSTKPQPKKSYKVPVSTRFNQKMYYSKTLKKLYSSKKKENYK